MSKQEVIDKDMLRAKNQPIYDEETGELLELPRFRTMWNMHLFDPILPPPNNQESMTVPNLAMTIPQMMERLQNGLAVPASKLEYMDNEDDDDPLPIVQDLMDIEEAREFARRIISDYDDKLKKAKTKKSEAPKEPDPELDLEN